MNPRPSERLLGQARDLAAALPGGYAYAVHGRDEALPVDPLPLFAQHAGQQRTLIWHGDGWLLAVGTAQAVEASGPGRGFHLAESCSALRTRTVCDHPALPLFLVALGFEDRAGEPGHWGARPAAAELLLAKRLYWRRRDSRGVVADALRVDVQQPPDAMALLADPPAVDSLPAAPWKDLHTGDYRDLVRGAIAQIELGGLRKIVCARAVDHRLDAPPDLTACLAHLHRHADERTYVYARDLDDGSCFVGATPELLFHANGEELTVLSLAGSCPRGSDAASDAGYAAALLGSTKERKEHQLVIEHIARQLRARADAVSIPATPTVRKLARMQHLETVLHCRIGELDPFDLLTALAPTPAVAGLPRESAVEWLRRHEGLHRGLYTGSLGLIAPGLARFVVPLRGGVLRGTDARLFAGAGIVETSEPEAELAETELKLRPMRQAIGVE